MRKFESFECLRASWLKNGTVSLEDTVSFDISRSEDMQLTDLVEVIPVDCHRDSGWEQGRPFF